MHPVREKLIAALARSVAAQSHRREAGVVEAIAALESWQKRRLSRSYADFVDHPRYRAATSFFTDELYAPANLEARDQDLERMTPLLVRMLPADTVETVADAIDLQALTLELDFAMVQHLPDAPAAIESMDLERYAAAYRAVGDVALRERQIELIIRVGWELDHLVANPLIGATLRLARTPARLAGLLDLQSFLEHGFDAFKTMRGAALFLGTIEARERRVMEALLAGDLPPLDAGDLGSGLIEGGEDPALG